MIQSGDKVQLNLDVIEYSDNTIFGMWMEKYKDVDLDVAGIDYLSHKNQIVIKQGGVRFNEDELIKIQ